jgi:hypothetical protein
MLFFPTPVDPNLGLQNSKSKTLKYTYALVESYNNSLKGVARCIPVGTEHLLMNILVYLGAQKSSRH